MVQVIELTPSSNGWYLAASPHQCWRELERATILFSPATVPANHDLSLVYDSSGQLRSAPEDGGVSFVA